MAERAKAQIDLVVNDKDVDKSLKEAENSFKGFGKTATIILGTVAAAFAFNRLYSFGDELLEIASVQEQSERRLQSVLETTGHVAGFTIDQLKGVASAYQSITTVGDEVILNTQAILATFKNVRGKEFTDATMAILDMSEVLGQDATSGAVQLGKALNDPILGVTALNRVGIQFTDTQKELIRTLQESGQIQKAQRIILDEVAGQMGGAATNAAQTFSGQMKQISNSWGDLKEEGGFLIAEVLKPLLPSLKSTIELLFEMATAMKPLAQQIGETAAEWLNWETDVDSLVATLMEWWAVSTTLFSRIDEVVAAGLLEAGASVVDFGDAIKYQFTEVIPWALETMWEVTKQVFSRFGEFISKVLENTDENIDNFVAALKAKMTGEDFNFTPVNPFKGFELELEKLPALGERKVSQTVRQMREAARGLEDDIGKDIAKAVQAARDKAANFEALELDFEGDPVPHELKLADNTVVQAELKDNKIKVETQDESEESAGLVEFFDKIATSARQTDPDWKVVEAVDRTTEAVNASIEAIKKIKGVPKELDFAPEEEDPLGEQAITRMIEDTMQQLDHAQKNLEGGLQRDMVKKAEKELGLLKDALKASRAEDLDEVVKKLDAFDVLHEGTTPEARNLGMQFERPAEALFNDEASGLPILDTEIFENINPRGLKPQDPKAGDKVDIKVEQDKVVDKLDEVVEAIGAQDTTPRFA